MFTNIFQAHHTNCKVIIGTEYKQTRMNAADVAELKKIFGDGNAFDFSGINEYTNNIQNYYEGSHYRPCLGRHLLEIAYSSNNKNE